MTKIGHSFAHWVRDHGRELGLAAVSLPGLVGWEEAIAALDDRPFSNAVVFEAGRRLPPSDVSFFVMEEDRTALDPLWSIDEATGVRAPPSHTDVASLDDRDRAAALASIAAVRPDLLLARVTATQEGTFAVRLGGAWVEVIADEGDTSWAEIFAAALETFPDADPLALLTGAPTAAIEIESAKEQALLAAEARSPMILDADGSHPVLRAERDGEKVFLVIYDLDQGALRRVDLDRVEGSLRINRAEPLRMRPPFAAPGHVVFRTGSTEVRLSPDAGNYYCEHLFFVLSRMAALDPSGILTNAQGEPLVGFLHAPDQPVKAEIPGAAIFGFFEEAARQVPAGEPVRMLLTGFGPYLHIKDNPTGDFAVEPSSVDAAMSAAFGDDLLTGSGRLLASGHDWNELEYRVLDREGDERTVIVRGQRLAVTDAAIDREEPSSIQAVIRSFHPHAVLSMGVTGRGAWFAEFRADDRALGLDPEISHSPGRNGTMEIAPNFALARALDAFPALELDPFLGDRTLSFEEWERLKPEAMLLPKIATPEARMLVRILASDRTEIDPRAREEIAQLLIERGYDARPLRKGPAPELIDGIIRSNVTEPDPEFERLVSLAGAEGNSSIVAVLEHPGFDLDHQAFADNLWLNPKEKPDGIDNDRNGLIDDLSAWDFSDGDNQLDEGAHGTHVMGIASRGTDRVKVMPLQVAYSDWVVPAIDYAAENGARVINMSFQVPFFKPEELPPIVEAIQRHPDVLFVLAADNEGARLGEGKFAPGENLASIELPNLAVIASADPDGGRSSFSNFGSPFATHAARGGDVFSAVPGGGFGAKSGTSMAAPNFAAEAARLTVLDPTLTPEELKRILAETSRAVLDENGASIWEGLVSSGGVIDGLAAERLVATDLTAAQP